MNHSSLLLSGLRLFLTSESACNYRSGLRSRNLVVDPETSDWQLYSRLAHLGFRRSGNYIYRPQCQDCWACRSLRIPVDRFIPDRSQRRTLARNRTVEVQIVPAICEEEHFALFSRYVMARHPGGGMDEGSLEDYWAFIRSRWAISWLAEFRQDQQLLAVAVVDRLEDGLSAVYTFFDPTQAERSLGVYAILWQITEARQRGLPWVYLGYWVSDCRKMAYKTRFQPHEIFIPEQRRWVASESTTPLKPRLD